MSLNSKIVPDFSAVICQVVPVTARTLTAQFLGAFGVVPDVGDFEFALDLGQALCLGLVVKDTSGARRCAVGDRRGGF
jgi:hypothetical protein